MSEVNLLKSLPKPKRSIRERTKKKSKKIIDISKKYGKLYFDGPREYGYGGYHYDGRWKPVAKDIIKKYKLKKKQKVLDIGCGKGFLVKDLVDLGIDAYGLDISKYGIQNSPEDIVGRLHLGSADNLNFADNSFDLVISINTIHNLTKPKCLVALTEIERVSKGKSFIQVDSYKSVKQKKIFLNWVLTAKYHDYPKNWVKLFKKAKYSGDWYWTIV
jgi:ubiquinone/menaquinone biosynthesis C-methylase UbiE